VAHFTRFGAEVDEATRRQIQRGRRLEAVLAQPVHQPLSPGQQLIVLSAATGGFLDDIPAKTIPAFERALLAHFGQEHPELTHQLDYSSSLTDPTRQLLRQTLTDFHATWREKGGMSHE
jgi:F-type H+-transporting ATPase subunit alpha